MAGDDVTITIRADNGDAIRAFRDAQGRLRDMSGRFIAEGNRMSGAMNKVGVSFRGLKGYLIPLATAATPLLASMTAATVKTAGAAAGAGVAVGAFGVALAGQVSSLSEASKAQTKYEDAVIKSGRGSKEAAEAQRTVQASLAGMPNATARASVSLTTLKDTFRTWSDDLAGFTMSPVEKSFTLLEQLLPKLTPMVQGTSTQLDRLVSVAGGAMATPGFDALSEKVGAFANESLKNAVDGIISFSRALSEGEASGPIKAFMDYADANGPAVGEALSTLGDAVTTLVEAAADAGPGMLTLVTAAAGLVAALPPELVATVMQLAVGLKLVSLAGAAAAAASSGVAALGVKIAALQAASGAAGGGMAGLVAAFGTLGKAAKASIIVAAIAALVVAVDQLSSIGDKAPPNVEKLTTSLANLGRTGKATGYVADQFGKDFGKLKDQIDKVTSPSVVESINNWGADISGGLLSAGDATEEFTESMDSIDGALTNMVKGGKADLAKAALKSMTEEMSPGQAKKFRESLDGYDQSLADMALEAKLTADSMGTFGQAAADTSAKLSAQKQSADGLRASILALNDVNRSAYDAQIGFEESLDGLTESFKEHGKTLNLDTEAGRANGQAMSDAAKAQDEFIATGLAAGESLGSMTKKSDELRETMMRLATDAFDGNKTKAREYVNELLGVPGDIKTLVKLEREEAITGLESVQAAIRETPNAKEVKVSTLNGAAIAALEAVGLKTRQLPDGQTAVFTANGSAIGPIGAVRTALDNLNGKTAATYVVTYYKRKDGASFLGPSGRYAAGGKVRGYAGGGDVQAYPDGGYIQGPGTGTSDDIVTLLGSGNVVRSSNTEFIVNARQTSKHRRLLELINSDRLPRFARGGVTKSEKEARASARGDLTLSHFGRMAGYKNPEIRGQLAGADSMGDLVSSLNKWRSIIKKATHGGLEENLLKKLNSAGKSLMKYERQHDTVSKALGKAKDKLADLKSAASQLSGSVKSGILSGANITKAAGAEDSKVTINTLLSQMQGSAANAGQFDQMLKDLKKRGLSGELIKQIAEAGIEGGGMETAAAILGGGKGEIKQLNELQKQIGKAAKSAGSTAADAMYGAGIKAAEGLVEGLKAKQAAIEKQMMAIAKSMEKAIKKALGIKSPSKVMEEVGGYTAEGFALGIRKNRSVTPAWASMLNQPRTLPSTGRAAGGGAASERPIVLNVSIADREFGQIWVDVGRKEVSTRGGLTATFGGS